MDKEKQVDGASEGTMITLGQVIEIAKQGRREILPTLRAFLDKHPQLWRHYGNLARQAEAQWLSLIGGDNLYLRECVERHTAELREQLTGPEGTPLERLLVDRICALNVQLAYYETLVGRYEHHTGDKVMAYLHERCAATDRRLQQAMLNLARIRRLLPGVLKVDVVVSGEVQASINTPDAKLSDGCVGDGKTRIRVPENRIKDLLASAN